MDDEDLEEMRALRASSKYKSSQASQRTSYTATFDLKSKDSEERERCPKTVDSRTKVNDAYDGNLLQDMMGFTGFGSKQVQAKSLDFEEALKQAKSKKNAASREKRASAPGTSTAQTIREGNESSDEESDDEMIGPMPPKSTDLAITSTSGNTTLDSMENSDSSDDDDGEGEENSITEHKPEKKIPHSHEITLNHGSKVISTLALDPAGARLISGSFDYEVKMWEFNSMDVNLNPFRTMTPMQSHSIKTIQYSPSGDSVVIAGGNAQAKVIDRNGHELYECKKGDQYIVDMVNTKGHVAMLNAACWNPKNRDEFLTCADDCTIRIWDINVVKKNKTVIKTKNQQAKKTIPTCFLVSKDGKLIVAACQDGSIQAWDTRKPFVHTTYCNRHAHAFGTDTSCLTFSFDGNLLASRGGDDTLKVWDFRQFKRPVNTVPSLISFYNVTRCIFSPDDKMIMTGTSVKKGGGDGMLLFFDRDTLNKVYEIPFENTSVVSCLWHHRINQLFIGCSNGDIKVLFDPDKSVKGATMCIGKVKKKKKDPGEAMLKEQIITPHALRMFREPKAKSMKKIKQDMRKDPIQSRKPDPPVLGPGHGGRISSGMSMSSFVVKQIALQKADDSNPREAILRHAKDAEENPFWVAPAYKKTQPVAVFQDPDEEKDSDDEHDSKRPRIN